MDILISSLLFFIFFQHANMYDVKPVNTWPTPPHPCRHLLDHEVSDVLLDPVTERDIIRCSRIVCHDHVIPLAIIPENMPEIIEQNTIFVRTDPQNVKTYNSLSVGNKQPWMSSKIGMVFVLKVYTSKMASTTNHVISHVIHHMTYLAERGLHADVMVLHYSKEIDGKDMENVMSEHGFTTSAAFPVQKVGIYLQPLYGKNKKSKL